MMPIRDMAAVVLTASLAWGCSADLDTEGNEDDLLGNDKADSSLDPTEPYEVATGLFDDAASGLLHCYFADYHLPAEVDGSGACGDLPSPNVWQERTTRLFETDIVDMSGPLLHDGKLHYGVTGQVRFRREARFIPETEECTFTLETELTDEGGWLEVIGTGLECQRVAPTSSQCTQQLADQVAPIIDHLLAPGSEGDAWYEVFSQYSASKGPITADTVLRELQWRTESSQSFVVPFDAWVDDHTGYLGASGVADFEELRAAINGELIDPVVVYLGEGQVNLFIVGRTSCGELAGLGAMLVQT